RLSGIPEIPRRSIFHALNQKSAAREACLRRGLRYEEADLIVAHLGGGVSVGAHRQGRVVDVNNALDGDGPFSPERSGTLPAGQLLTLALSGEKSEAHLRRLLTGGGGLVAYCGTNSLRELRTVIAQGQAGALPPASAPASGGTFSAPDAGSPATVAEAAIAAMVYQIAQEIAKHGATLLGAVDLVVLTGGMAHDHELVESISRRVAYLAPIEVIPGEREMESLAAAATRALRGEQEVREYQ
ncbi:MAG: butyrate kinase, partial [Spirochaetota bacterium]